MTDAAAPARPTLLLLPLAFVNFTVGAGAFLVIGMLSPLAQSLSMSKVQAGWVMSAYALGYALTSPVLIALTDRLRRRTVILTGITIFVVASLLSAVASTPGCGLALGLAISFCWNAAGWGFTVPQRARLMAIDPKRHLSRHRLGSAIAGIGYEGWGIEATALSVADCCCRNRPPAFFGLAGEADGLIGISRGFKRRDLAVRARAKQDGLVALRGRGRGLGDAAKGAGVPAESAPWCLLRMLFQWYLRPGLLLSSTWTILLNLKLRNVYVNNRSSRRGCQRCKE